VQAIAIIISTLLIAVSRCFLLFFQFFLFYAAIPFGVGTSISFLIRVSAEELPTARKMEKSAGEGINNLLIVERNSELKANFWHLCKNLYFTLMMGLPEP